MVLPTFAKSTYLSEWLPLLSDNLPDVIDYPLEHVAVGMAISFPLRTVARELALSIQRGNLSELFLEEP
jgi:hypothetical protein